MTFAMVILHGKKQTHHVNNYSPCEKEEEQKLTRSYTRSYTADAVWYRQPSGQPTNMVMLNLN